MDISKLPRLKSRRSTYSKEEEQLIITKFGELSPVEIAGELNHRFHDGKQARTAAGVAAKLRGLGLVSSAISVKTSYSRVEDEILCDVYITEGPSCYDAYNEHIKEYNDQHGTDYPSRSAGSIDYRVRHIKKKQRED